jgi:hypothetical protein
MNQIDLCDAYYCYCLYMEIHQLRAFATIVTALSWLAQNALTCRSHRCVMPSRTFRFEVAA